MAIASTPPRSLSAAIAESDARLTQSHMIVAGTRRHEQRPLRDGEPTVDADSDEVTIMSIRF